MQTTNRNIVIISNTLWSVVRFRQTLIKALMHKGYSVVCIADNSPSLYQDTEVIEELGCSYINLPMCRKETGPLCNINYLIRLYRILKKINPDHIFSFTPKPNIFGSIAAALLRIRTTPTIEGLGSGLLSNNLLARVMRVLYKISLKWTSQVFLLNNDDVEYFVGRKIIKRDIAVVVPGSGIDTRQFSPTGLPINRPLRFAFAGRFLKDKGISEYISAARSFKKQGRPEKFYVAGYRDPGNPSVIEENTLNKAISEDIIVSLDALDDITELFRVTDIIVLPSYREGLSRVLLEAASCGKAMIATDVPGCREIVLDGVTGLLCKPQSNDDLVRTLEIMTVMSDREIVEMGEKAREHVARNFSAEEVTPFYINRL